jgi:hypothetical protein
LGRKVVRLLRWGAIQGRALTTGRKVARFRGEKCYAGEKSGAIQGRALTTLGSRAMAGEAGAKRSNMATLRSAERSKCC